MCIIVARRACVHNQSLHFCILCIRACLFSTHLVCFIGMHSDVQSCLAYIQCTRVICKYICTWLLLVSQGEYVTWFANLVPTVQPTHCCFCSYYALILLYVCMVIYGLVWPDPSLCRGTIACCISTYTASDNARTWTRIWLCQTS